MSDSRPLSGYDRDALLPVLISDEPNEPRASIRLELFRRHTSTCPDRARGRNWLKCSGKRPCPLYCDGTVNGRRFRKSLGRDLGRAEKRLAQIEHTGHTSGQDRTLAQMVKLYLHECRANHLAARTLQRYERILNALVVFAGKDPDLGQPFLTTLSEFRLQQGWKAQTTMRLELLVPTSAYERSYIEPIYLRGLAYLHLHKGREAAAEFQKIVDHKGANWGATWIHPYWGQYYSLSFLEMARGSALAGDKDNAKKSFQNFFELWKDADPDIPISKQAKAEYAHLQ